jgi:hypothetical protein
MYGSLGGVNKTGAQTSFGSWFVRIIPCNTCASTIPLDATNARSYYTLLRTTEVSPHSRKSLVVVYKRASDQATFNPLHELIDVNYSIMKSHCPGFWLSCGFRLPIKDTVNGIVLFSFLSLCLVFIIRT